MSAMTPRDNRRAWRLAVTALVWTMWATSLCLPVVEHSIMGGEPSIESGFSAMCMTTAWPEIIANFANVALLAGWIGYANRMCSLALIGGVVAVGCTASTPAVTGIALNELMVGYWAWVATMSIFALAAGYEFFLEMCETSRSNQA